MKKYDNEIEKEVRTRNPNVKFGNLKEEIYTWFYVEYNEDGTLVDNPPIRVRVIGKTFPDSKYWVKRDNSPHFILEYVCDGIGYVECDGETYTVEKGDVYLLKPGSNHKYWADPKNPYTKMWINFHCDIFAKTIEAMGIDKIVKFPKIFCEELFEELLRIEEKSLFHNSIAFEVMEILLKIATRLHKAVHWPNNNIPEQINNIKYYLDRSLYENITIEDICEKYLLSKTYVISNFKKYFGMTPHQYLIDRKIKLSTTLLSNKTKSLTEIANILSFYDLYHFSKTFKQIMKVSPSEYRAKINNN